MFWGITIDDGKHYTQTVEESFHISMAALETKDEKDVKKLSSPLVSIMVKHEKAEFLICTLEYGKLVQQPLSLNFTEGEEVTFFIEGTGVVHLTGYEIPENKEVDFPNMEEGDEGDLTSGSSSVTTDTESSASEAEEEDEDHEEVPTLQQLALTVNGINGNLEEDEESEEEEWKPGKRKKRNKKKQSANDEDQKPKRKKISGSDEDDDDDDDEDDEDDEDYIPNNKSKEVEESDDTSDESDDLSDEDYSPVGDKKKKKKVAKNKEDDTSDDEDEDDYELDDRTDEDSDDDDDDDDDKEEDADEDESDDEENTSTEKSDQMVVSSEEKKKKSRPRKKARAKNKQADMTSGDAESIDTPPKENSKTQKLLQKKLKGGTVIKDLKQGSGKIAKLGKMVALYYTGKLSKNNKQFDSCLSGKPFNFRLGQGEVIKGWDLGVQGMKVGGKRIITIPSSQGYGSKKVGRIPANSSLTFEVELKSVS